MPINQKKKGSNSERECAKILNERFGEGLFRKTIFSGAYVGGSNRKSGETLTEEQKLMFASDIRCPVNFKYVVEHKAYADKATIWELFNEKSDLNSWIKQVEGDADFVNKLPMLVVKYNNHKRIVFIKEKTLQHVFKYKDWYCLWFEDLLKEENSFFFL